ncbi:FAD:protein FMN transferase [Silicimonas algicola]|uniref:FAD:protein FMN transferase n=1 Tax=Silicimonas algicola TaxID=1826607 RepID=A0A316GG77_9RHOB|nr:FAD:protein FMN transferase [Silicimonas algicola]AZQ66620.1 FAD:protein FMN transferase [Silicimonas algicola]PWK58966.1 thiamine biosynthesis lipoprotein [Silicimonas algicola]
MKRANFSRREAIGLLGAALACPSLAHSATPERLEGNAFGTTWRIVGPSDAGLARLRPALDDLFAGIDAEMSPWRTDSDISRFNASAQGGAASEEMLRVTQAALGLAGASGGTFDPTVGPLVARWGFGPILRGGGPDWRGIRIEGGTIVKSRGELTLDLCGIAKGRALDRAAELARSHGLETALLDLGGELSALGRHPSGRDWQVAVEHPVRSQSAAALLHLPDGMAVATSGLSQQSYSVGASIWGHIIDPAAAAPVQGRLRSVTVLAADAMTADGWATALFAAGDDAGPALARDRDIAALFLFEEEMALRRIETGSIKDVLA